MSKTIHQLKTKWNKEKEFYKVQEIGTGVQSFVKGCLESEEIFNLKEGKLSTKDEVRKKEFIHEKVTKKHRKGDFIIFIDPEIIIPIEVKCYENIERGKKQLREYQKDLGKKYGVLTDGFTWRFYNDHIPIREFCLSEIFSDPSLFVDFWKEYIKPKYYYLSFFEKKGQLFLFENKLFVEENRETFFEDITTLIGTLKNKLKIEGYFKGLPEKERVKKATEITYAYIIQFILYKTLVDNAFGDFEKEHEENVKNICEYIRNSRYKDILSIIDGISWEISKNVYRPFSEEQKAISQKILQLYRNKNRLSDVSPWLDILVFINKYNFQNVRNEIFGYIYENYLKELFKEENKGQYFTDSAVVSFMLQQIGYTPEEIKKKITSEELDKLSIIDPACGSGTFLYRATDSIIKSFPVQTEEVSKQIEEIVNKNVFGLDIAEFPLYLAEMNIIMRMLPLIMGQRYNNPIDKKIKVFETKDSVAEFIGAGLENTDVDQYVQQGQTLIGFPEQELDYDSFMRDKDDLKETKESLRKHDKIPRRRFDYVIANPPYVGYNECSKQRLLITQMIQKKKAQMSNIYGVNLNTVPGRIKAYAPKPNLYAFFVALGLALLKDNGKLCYIIPQTILTAGDLDVLRYHLAKFVTIDKIITFNINLFISRGLRQKKVIPTSSLIFVVTKKLPTADHRVEILNYKDGEDAINDTLKNILEGKKIDKKIILQSELLKNVANWNFIKQEKRGIEFFEFYKRNPSIDIYRIPGLSRPKFNSIFYFDKGLAFPKNRILSAREARENMEFYHLVKPKKDKYKLRITDKIVCERDIRFPKGSQGIDVYKRKYKIVWAYMNPDRFYFSDKKIMVSFNWIIISADNKDEILYLLSLLNSNCNKFIFESLLRVEREKDILVGIKVIKEFFHIPKITKQNESIKNEVIKCTGEMLALEGKTLSDFVDFSGVLMQRFKEIRIEKSYLFLTDGDTTIKLKIRDDPELVANILNRELKSNGLKLEKKKVNLSYLRSIPIMDFRKQRDLKDYIDLLVFALYCNIPLEKVKFNKGKEIKRLCSKNKYFTMVTECQR